MSVNVKESIENIKESIKTELSALEITMNILITVGIGVLTLFLIFYYICARKVKVVEVLERATKRMPAKPRFRKRDKVMFYGRKMLRKVRSFAKHTIHDVSSTGRSAKKRRQLITKIARQLLQFKKDQTPQLQVREPPPSLLEADWPEMDHEHRLPPEVMYMLRSVRVLGHFEKPIFLELCKYMESRFVTAGEYLFRVGDIDDSIFVVQSGQVKVTISETDGTEYVVKVVNRGDSIHSLLSILDVLTETIPQARPTPLLKMLTGVDLDPGKRDRSLFRGPRALQGPISLDGPQESSFRPLERDLHHPAPYKTVSAVAVQDSTILRLPAQAFQMVLDRYPESLVRVVQIIMVRLQRVTFMALHNYLGLSYELINPQSQSDKSLSIHSIAISPKGSPVKRSLGELTSRLEERQQRLGTVDEEGDPKRRGSLIGNRGPVVSGYTRARAMSMPNTGTLKRIPTTDFEEACSRARVDVARQSDDSGVSLSSSPSVKRGEMMEATATRSVPIDLSTAAGSSSYLGSSGSPCNTGPGAPHTPSRRSRKAMLSDNIEIIPEAGSASNLSNEEMLEMAAQDIVKLLGLEDENLLKGKLIFRQIPMKTELVKQGDQDAHLIFVVTGQLQVYQQVVGTTSDETTVFMVNPGELVGSLAVLTGEPSFFTIRARTEARIVTISKFNFYSIMQEQPKVVLNVAHTVVKRMSGFVRQIDFALDWMMIEAGRALFRQGDQSDSIYIILNGRLRSVVTQQDGKKELVGEYGRGELMGLVEILTQSERATTVMAVRDTELAQIPDELLGMIKRKYPQIVTRLIHLLGQRILGSLKKPNITSSLSEHPNVEPRPTVANLATVAILPVTDDVPLSNFALEFQHAVSATGPCLRLTSDVIIKKLGNTAFDTVNEYRLSSWLAQQEDINRMVLYQCDYRMTPWTQHCIRQADCILAVALGDSEPTLGKLEKQMDSLAVRAQKELILLYKEGRETPHRTIEWLNMRGWITSHHHIRCPKRVFSKKPPHVIQEVYNKVFAAEPDIMSDFSRLARLLTGTAIGLVLGGGGARGLAHVGMIRAMQEAGIPIDIVGGVSIGSLIGGLWCEETNMTPFTQRAREWSMQMTSLWRTILDLTYPVTAMFKGGAFNQGIKKVFQERQIEDLWLPYFCVSTDITASKMRVHTSGSLWRYVRASMSLSGYLPPLCDPIDGHLLLDGGYVNNLPADVMKSQGASTIFAIDVGSQDETSLSNYGDELSGWWLLWKRWNPWTDTPKVPNMAEIQSRLAYVSCVQQLETVKNSGLCEYIRPPIDKYQTLQFGAFDEIHDVGYHHGKALFAGLTKSGLIQDIYKGTSDRKVLTSQQKSSVPREANFTDLAEIISRINEPRSKFEKKFYLLDSDDEEYVDIDEEDLYEEEEEVDEDMMSVASEPETLRPYVRLANRPKSEGASPVHTPPNSASTDNLTEEDLFKERTLSSSNVSSSEPDVLPPTEDMLPSTGDVSPPAGD